MNIYGKVFHKYNRSRKKATIYKKTKKLLSDEKRLRIMDFQSSSKLLCNCHFRRRKRLETIFTYLSLSFLALFRSTRTIMPVHFIWPLLSSSLEINGKFNPTLSLLSLNFLWKLDRFVFGGPKQCEEERKHLLFLM